MTDEQLNKQFATSLVSAVIGGAIGIVIRKKMYNAGMIKSFWLPCMIRKPGTYTRPE